MSRARGIGAVALVAVAGLGVWAVREVRADAPLEWAGGASGADTRAPGFYDAVETRGEGGEIRTAYVFRLGPGQTFRMGVDVYNGGRFPVRIEGIERSAPGALQLVGLEIQPKPQVKTFQGLQRPPFTLEPGEYVFLVPFVRAGGTCGPAGASHSVEAIRVRYSYLRYFERSETVALPMVVVQACGDPSAVVRNLAGA